MDQPWCVLQRKIIKDVAIVVNNGDSNAILAEMDKHQNSLTLETRFDLAIKAI